MTQSRENADGTMTYWQDGADEPPAVESGKVNVRQEADDQAEVQSKVVEAPEPKKASGRSRASSK